MFGINKIIPADTNYPFMDYRKIFIISSLILILSSVLLLSFKGLNLGIDFKGGTLIEISTKNSDIAELRRILSPNFNDVSLQEFGNSETIIIRLQNETNVESIETVNQVKNLINDKVSEFRRSEFVGPTISSELLWKGLQAISFALLAILTYIWLRFDWQFGFGAVVALSHDVLFTLGVLSLFNIDFSLSSIAAILTICGYSLNDSVVIYDRIRENLRKYKKLELSELFNVSINNTLSRTIMTSLTTLIALFSLYIFGGEVIKPFAFAMIIGVIIGTYSSIYIAVPTLLIFKFRPQEEDNKLI
ncbi:MAG TPA: protein translocase subunit SecF [Pelagibacterales bacterium]|jgi:preprotein translocase subunit SecF|nr:protein translocase subunit SecF [Pelagibacterales bacterium]|tara:strand:- start:5355 stop:6263 length:909 start_codon:yes stop_codon:yes gene_type:complete